MCLPNFFIVGAMKAATTTVYDLLRQHPDIFLPSLKEPHFFLYGVEKKAFSTPVRLDRYGKRPAATQCWADYVKLFEKAGNTRAVGEASSHYFPHPDTPIAIRDTFPNAKIVIMLRDPALRAYSAYNFLRMRDHEPIDRFEAALDAEAERMQNRTSYAWLYVHTGRYATHIKQWLSIFGEGNVKICFFDDLRDAPLTFLRELCNFLCVDPNFEPKKVNIRNVTTQPTALSRGVQKLFDSDIGAIDLGRRLVRAAMPDEARSAIVALLRSWQLPGQNKRPPKLAESTRQRINGQLEQEIRQVESLTGRKLSHWLR
jgi:Sulfotransferase domain